MPSAPTTTARAMHPRSCTARPRPRVRRGKPGRLSRRRMRLRTACRSNMLRPTPPGWRIGDRSYSCTEYRHSAGSRSDPGRVLRRALSCTRITRERRRTLRRRHCRSPPARHRRPPPRRRPPHRWGPRRRRAGRLSRSRARTRPRCTATPRASHVCLCAAAWGVAWAQSTDVRLDGLPPSRPLRDPERRATLDAIYSGALQSLTASSRFSAPPDSFWRRCVAGSGASFVRGTAWPSEL
jgi:hypothetical protein